MKKLLVMGALIWFILPVTALADEPLRPTGQISVTDIIMPFDFEVIDFDRTGPALPEIDFVDTALISQIGSIALTLFSFFSVEIVGIFIVLMLAVLALGWLFSFVTDTPTAGLAIKQYDIGVGMTDIVDITYDASRASLGQQERALMAQTDEEIRGLINDGVDSGIAAKYGDWVNDRRLGPINQRRDDLKQYRNYYRQGSAAWKRTRR